MKRRRWGLGEQRRLTHQLYSVCVCVVSGSGGSFIKSEKKTLMVSSAYLSLGFRLESFYSNFLEVRKSSSEITFQFIKFSPTVIHHSLTKKILTRFSSTTVEKEFQNKELALTCSWIKTNAVSTHWQCHCAPTRNEDWSHDNDRHLSASVCPCVCPVSCDMEITAPSARHLLPNFPFSQVWKCIGCWFIPAIWPIWLLLRLSITSYSVFSIHLGVYSANIAAHVVTHRMRHKSNYNLPK